MISLKRETAVDVHWRLLSAGRQYLENPTSVQLLDWLHMISAMPDA
jgi:hypothetical protein